MVRGGILNIEWSLLVPVFVLVVLSLATLFSINVNFFRTQITYLIISLFAFVFFSNFNYKIFKLYAVPIYVVSIILLLIVLIIGFESRGAVRWIDIFGLRIQFSEILKPFLAISFSSYLASNRETSFKNLFSIFCLILPVVFLVFIQPDLGNALIFLIVAVLTLIIAGFPFFWFIGGFFAFIATTPLIWHFLHDYQKQRISTFLNPTHDPLGTSYNTIQAVMAVGSGMFFGKGLGEGTQSMLRFLPERHTDFIFATISEEFGFLGSIVIIASLIFLLYKFYVIYSNSSEDFCKIFVACSFFLILVQLFFNIGMNVGIVPVVGVTLPFVSYGGSSILSNFILLGFISSISKNFRNKDTLEIR